MEYAWKKRFFHGSSDTPTFFGAFALFALVVVMCLDSILTNIGVNLWGLNVEANPLIRWAMSEMGVGPGLAVAKIVSIGFSALIYWWCLYGMLVMLTIIYIVVSIIPWIYLFMTF